MKTTSITLSDDRGHLVLSTSCGSLTVEAQELNGQAVAGQYWVIGLVDLGGTRTGDLAAGIAAEARGEAVPVDEDEAHRQIDEVKHPVAHSIKSAILTLRGIR